MTQVDNRVVAGGACAMAAIVITANVLMPYSLGPWLSWGTLVFPLSFLVTDLTNRIYGTATARSVVLIGFAVGVLCTIVGTRIHGANGALVTQRIALGSGLAFLLAQLSDITVFNRFRHHAWWRAPLVSSAAAGVIDSTIFFTISFAAFLQFLEPGTKAAWATEPVPLLGIGAEAPFWVSLLAMDIMVKGLFAVAVLAPFRVIVSKVTTTPA